MTLLKRYARAALMLFALVPIAHAADPVMVHKGWVREMPPGTQNAAAYFMLHNNQDVERTLVGASTDVAEKVELHTVVHQDGAMKMQQIDAIVVPGDGMAMLEPGGNHVMLIGVAERLTKGTRVEMTLQFANGDAQTVSLKVKRGKAMKHDHNMNSKDDDESTSHGAGHSTDSGS